MAKKTKTRGVNISRNSLIFVISLTFFYLIFLYEFGLTMSQFHEVEIGKKNSFQESFPNNDLKEKKTIVPVTAASIPIVPVTASMTKILNKNKNKNNSDGSSRINNEKLSNIDKNFKQLAKMDYSSLENSLNPLSTFCEKTFWSTFKTTLMQHEFGIFVVTGDIPDMWIRDSAVQISPYIAYMNDVPAFQEIVNGVAQCQQKFINYEPYANSYSQKWRDPERLNDFERGLHRGNWTATYNYELDSGCYHIELLFNIFQKTGNLDASFQDSIWTLMRLWKLEQHHEEKSPYRYKELPRNGLGTPVGYTGMSWSAHRPSDDKTKFGYLVPSNIFAAVVLEYVKILATFWKNEEMKSFANTLQKEIKEGIEKFATYEHKEFGKMYAYEVDGLGQRNLIDDANIPSLLSIPLIDPFQIIYDEKIYENTKKYVLSANNPYFYSGKHATGVGSPHTGYAGNGMVWHLSLIIESYLLTDHEQKLAKLKSILETTSSTLHESFSVHDWHHFTRPWFTWPDSLFAKGPWCAKTIEAIVEKEGKNLKTHFVPMTK